MESYDRFEELLKLKGLKATEISKMTGISTSTLTDWKKGRYQPKQEKMQKIAECLDTTAEYILTGDIGKAPAFSAEALEMFKLYEKASPEVQLAVMAALKAGQRKS